MPATADTPAAASVKPAFPDFLPFSRPTISAEAMAEVQSCLASGWITTGPRVGKFEGMLRDYCGAPHALTVTSATAGLYLALVALKLRPGDEVITTPLTFVASLNVIVLAGGKPVLVDVDRRTYQMDVGRLAAAITPRTRAIMPVHYAGMPVDLDPLYALAKERGLRVIEDAAHAIGTEYRGRRIGSFGDIQVFSFHPNKNITTGEGGAVVCRDDALAAEIRLLRFHGIDREAWARFGKKGDQHYEVIAPGYKFNLTDMQAALGIHQLPALEGFNARRLELARRYQAAFVGWKELAVQGDAAYPHRHAWHLFAPLVTTGLGTRLTREAFMAALKERNVGTGLHYRAAHLYPYYREQFGWKPGDFPNAEHIGDRIVSLPLFPLLTDAQQDGVIAAIRDVFDHADPALSIVIPVFNEEKNLPVLFERLYPVLDSLGRSYEVIFTNDGSRDRSLELLRAQHGRRPDVTRVIDFNANYGQHLAVMAAFERVRGEVTVVLDADLQNPPEEIPKLVALTDAGHDYVGGFRIDRQDSLFRTLASKAINVVRSRTTSIKMTDQGCMLRAYRRPIVDAVARSGAVITFIPALAYTYATNPTEVGVRHEDRHAGTSNYTLYKLIRLNFDLITGFSLAPLQAFTMFALASAAGSLLLVLILAYRRLFLGAEVGGTFTLFGILFFLLSVAMVGIGLIGEYVGRTYQVVRARQRYVVREMLESGTPGPKASG